MPRSKQVKPTPWYDAIDDYLGGEADQPKNPESLPEEIYRPLAILRRRFDVYALNNTPLLTQYDGFSRWKEKKYLQYYGDKLVKSLLTYKTIHNLEAKNPVDQTKKEALESAIQEVILIQLKKLELLQFQMIRKTNNIKPNAYGLLEKELKEKRKSLNEDLKIRKASTNNRYSTLAAEIDELNISSNGDTFKNNNVATFFIGVENKPHFNRYEKATSHVSTSLYLLNNIIRLAIIIANSAPAVISLLKAVGIFINSIPFVAAITSAIGIIIHAAKLWVKNRNNREKAEATLLLAIAIGSIITMGVAVYATAIIAVGLMITGATIRSLLPLRKELQSISKKQADIQQTKINIQNKTYFPLHNIDKVILLSKLETVWTDNFKYNHNDLLAAKKIILSGHAISHLESPLIEDLFGKHKTIESLLDEERHKRIQALEDEVIDSKREAWKFGLNMFTTSFAIAGGILLCIPFPPAFAFHLLVGSLFLVSTLLGIGMRSTYGERLCHFIVKKPKDVGDSTTSESDPTNLLTKKASLDEKPKPTTTFSLVKNSTVSSKNEHETEKSNHPPSHTPSK